MNTRRVIILFGWQWRPWQDYSDEQFCQGLHSWQKYAWIKTLFSRFLHHLMWVTYLFNLKNIENRSVIIQKRLSGMCQLMRHEVERACKADYHWLDTHWRNLNTTSTSGRPISSRTASSSRFHWIFVFDNLIGMTVSVGNASSKRFQMETYIKSKTDFYPYTSISPTFFFKDKGVRSQKGIWTPLCKDVLHTYLDFMRHHILL